MLVSGQAGSDKLIFHKSVCLLTSGGADTLQCKICFSFHLLVVLSLQSLMFSSLSDLFFSHSRFVVILDPVFILYLVFCESSCLLQMVAQRGRHYD